VITKKNKIKIWAISLLDLVLSLAVRIFFDVDFIAIRILSTLLILVFAYLVTVKNKQWAVWLWIASFALPRVLNFSQMASSGQGILSIFFGVTFLAVIIRCFLQWSANIWRSPSRKISQKLLSLWIYTEELLVIGTTSAIVTLLIPKKGSHVLTTLSILGLVALYKKIKKHFSAALNCPNHFAIEVIGKQEA